MKSIFIILFNIIIVIVQIIGVILVIFSSEMLKSNIIYLANILDNWSSTPINKIKLSDYDCPFGYEPILVNKYSISCDFNLDRDLLERSETPHIFRNEKKQTFCEERLQNFFYFQHKQTKKCNSNEKDCGILDTLGNRYCVNINIDCPINRMSIKHHETNMSQDKHHLYAKNKEIKDKNLTNIEYLPINKDYSLAYSNIPNDNNSYLVVDIEIIQGI